MDLLKYEGYIFDLDGTIYLSNRLLANADRVIASLLRQSKKVVFLTNKPIESRAAYAEKLNRMGISVTIDNIINSSLVTADCIRQEKPGAVVYVIGEPPLIEELESAGLQITQDPLQADFLVVAFDRTFHYNKLNDAMIALKNGARYFATNPDRTCPVDGGEIPDCAGMMGAIEGVTGRRPELICGKPSPQMLKTALNRLQLPVESCLMIGDRLETDIQMGIDLGIDTALVLTGITNFEMLKASPIKPTYVLQSVADILIE
ncbi:MAG: HAD-IIA family hydrolase [Candidatus Wallacebacter cryptica]|jgi:arabinose operon protein AraL|nr:HAD-IIA family hydrolase [Bacillota bacterium]